jgi:polyisoprenoid-binding protein YceI
LRRFRLVPARSVVLVEARSSAGPLSFGTAGVGGFIAVDVADDALRLDTPPTAHIEIGVDGLRSGDSLHDAELLRCIDAHQFPTATIDLTEVTAVGDAERYRLSAKMTFHGVTRVVEGAVSVDIVDDDLLVVTAEHVLDVRDFDVASPTVQMLRIYPDVRVRLHAEAEPEN